jgi:hypothetical protein
MDSRSGMTEIAWGAVWSNTRRPLDGRENGDGIVREVDPGVEYFLKPEPELPIPRLRKEVPQVNETDFGDIEPSFEGANADCKRKLVAPEQSPGSDIVQSPITTSGPLLEWRTEFPTGSIWA